MSLRRGLVPSWAVDPKIGYRTINTRLDTAPTKPAFRSAFKHRHCLVLADGFYEWQKTSGKIKRPYHIRLRDGGPFAFAGLFLAADHGANRKPALQEQGGHGSPDRAELTRCPG